MRKRHFLGPPAPLPPGRLITLELVLPVVSLQLLSSHFSARGLFHPMLPPLPLE